MKIYNYKYEIDENSILNYYEVKNDNPKLLLLHAQGTNSNSFSNCIKKISKHFHIFLVDYYGHGIHAEKTRDFINTIIKHKSQIR